MIISPWQILLNPRIGQTPPASISWICGSDSTSRRTEQVTSPEPAISTTIQWIIIIVLVVNLAGLTAKLPRPHDEKWHIALHHAKIPLYLRICATTFFVSLLFVSCEPISRIIRRAANHCRLLQDRIGQIACLEINQQFRVIDFGCSMYWQPSIPASCSAHRTMRQLLVCRDSDPLRLILFYRLR